MAYKYDASWREEVVLRSGRRVLLRSVRPEDKELLTRGFAELSTESRYLRFFTPKAELTREDLSYLTEVDGENHVAIGAIGRDDDAGLGIARCIRFPGEPDVAEAAVVVTDRAQGEGLGTLLLCRLAEAARERGVAYFRVEVLAENEAMQHVLKSLHPNATFLDQGAGVVEGMLPLPLESEPLEERAIQRMLSHVARSMARVSFGRWLLKDVDGE